MPVPSGVDSLEGRDLADAVALIKLLEERGNTLRPPHSTAIGGRLFELRRNQVRIFSVFGPRRRITLLSGIVKKQDKIPASALEQARRLKREAEAKHGKPRVNLREGA